MKGRSKGRALERRPFEKSCSKKDAQKKAFHVRDVSWEQSAHSDIFLKKLSPAPEAFRKRFHGWTDEKPLETEAALLGCLDISYS